MSIPIRAQPLQYPRAMNAPSSFQALLEAIAQYTLYLFDPDYILAVKGANTPQAQDNNKLWVKTDAIGRPLGLYVMYNGKWRQTATGNPFQIAMFAGSWPTYFDPTGLSYPGQPWDGWAIANGNNGTLNLVNHFLVPGFKYENGKWITIVDGTEQSTGGNFQATLAPDNLPALHVTMSTANNFETGGNWTASTDPGAGGATGTWIYQIDNTGQAIPISTIPPFIALGFVQYVGYNT